MQRQSRQPVFAAQILPNPGCVMHQAARQRLRHRAGLHRAECPPMPGMATYSAPSSCKHASTQVMQRQGPLQLPLQSRALAGCNASCDWGIKGKAHNMAVASSHCSLRCIRSQKLCCHHHTPPAPPQCHCHRSPCCTVAADKCRQLSLRRGIPTYAETLTVEVPCSAAADARCRQI